MGIKILPDSREARSDLPPFNPGPGAEPPYLAGRESQERTVRHALERLVRGRGRGGFLILVGPRGNGKTVMLGWGRRKAEELGIDTLNLTAAGIGTEQKLVAQLAPSKWWDRIRRLSVALITVATDSGAEPTIAHALHSRLKRGPLVLLIDEAHVLNVAVGRVLLPEAQKLVSEGLPLLLALAGTPGLPSRLSAMESSFWERSRFLVFDRLDNESAADAIRIPLEEAGVAITPDALAWTVDQSHGYPYFLQLLGERLWNHALNDRGSIALKNARLIQTGFEIERNRFYGRRYGELERHGLVPAAVALAKAYGNEESLPRHRIVEVLRNLVGPSGAGPASKDVVKALEQLNALGYIWTAESGVHDRWVKGIPSLMEFVAANAAD